MPGPVLIAFALLAAPAMRTDDPGEDQFALTISGGVSLGSYEIGAEVLGRPAAPAQAAAPA